MFLEIYNIIDINYCFFSAETLKKGDDHQKNQKHSICYTWIYFSWNRDFRYDITCSAGGTVLSVSFLFLREKLETNRDLVQKHYRL